LKRLRADGVTIAVDDFGTGYSNLARLREMPVDRVKIDQSLIADIATSERARTLVHSVIGLVHGMGFKAVAEGVETREQQEVLSIIGCDTIQGYAIAHPMHEAELDRWLASRISRAA
jgi:EAL domain-containing protein (putative c-di-GMP-specific phosphodiesterase class I)